MEDAVSLDLMKMQHLDDCRMPSMEITNELRIHNLKTFLTHLSALYSEVLPAKFGTATSTALRVKGHGAFYACNTEARSFPITEAQQLILN